MTVLLVVVVVSYVVLRCCLILSYIVGCKLLSYVVLCCSRWVLLSRTIEQSNNRTIEPWARLYWLWWPREFGVSLLDGASKSLFLFIAFLFVRVIALQQREYRSERWLRCLFSNKLPCGKQRLIDVTKMFSKHLLRAFATSLRSSLTRKKERRKKYTL